MREEAICFGGSNALVGVLSRTRPETEPMSCPAAIILNAGRVHRIGPHRMHVRLARRMARIGFHVLRFDFSGIGDSPPRDDRITLARARLAEAVSAIELMSEWTTSDELVLVGLCTGADAAFRTALADDRVTRVILIDAFPHRTLGWYVRHYSRRLLRRESWWNLLSGRHKFWRIGAAPRRGRTNRTPPSREESISGLRTLLDRGTKVLCIYTSGMNDYYNSPSQFREIFGSLADEPALNVTHLAGTDHVFSQRESQQRLNTTVCDWLSRRASPSRMPSECPVMPSESRGAEIA